MQLISAATSAPPPTMNATSLLVSTSRLVFQYEPGDQQILSDLYRLVPYLRQSLSCTVCGSLLIEPYTPQETQCQHHVCRLCIGGRKNLKPTCSWCRDYQKYEVNTQLRILLQCYKNLCEYIIAKPIYSLVGQQHQVHNGGGAGTGASSSSSSSSTSNSLIELIEEGARFQDNYKSNSGLLKSTYSILPCVYTTPTTQMMTAAAAAASSTLTTTTSHHPQQQHLNTVDVSAHHNHHHQQHHPQQQQNKQQTYTSSSSVTPISAPIKTVSNGSAMYSVLYAGSGNKITIKRKTDHSTPSSAAAAAAAASVVMTEQSQSRKDELSKMNSIGSIQPNTIVVAGQQQQQQQQQNFKKPTASRTKQQQKRKGCRCGNATPTPGKLTCCGQRCPCYVEAKSCLDCKCRGCRNPHRADGFKVSTECEIILKPYKWFLRLDSSTHSRIGLYRSTGRRYRVDDDSSNNHHHIKRFCRTSLGSIWQCWHK